MKIEIIDKFSSEGKNEPIYCWKLYDGPDGIYESSGECKSLGECLEAIISSRIINSIHCL